MSSLFRRKVVKTFIVLMLLSLLSSCASTGSFVVNLAAKAGNYQKHTHIPYRKDKSLDVYTPEPKKNDPSPVVIFFYGGCWGACQSTDKSDYEFIADTLASKGYVVVIPDYRHYPQVKFDQIIADAAQATEWVYQNIALYHGDNQKLFLMGHSAGGHLAAMLGANEDYLSPEVYQSVKGVIGLAGPYDFIPYTEDYLPDIFGPAQQAAYTQPINFIDGNEPPYLLLYGDKDVTVMRKNIVNLTAKIKSKSGRVESRIYKDMDHLDIVTGLSRILFDKKLVGDIESFLEAH